MSSFLTSFMQITVTAIEAFLSRNRPAQGASRKSLSSFTGCGTLIPWSNQEMPPSFWRKKARQGGLDQRRTNLRDELRSCPAARLASATWVGVDRVGMEPLAPTKDATETRVRTALLTRARLSPFVKAILSVGVRSRAFVDMEFSSSCHDTAEGKWL
jgi:hypothetical protein